MGGSFGRIQSSAQWGKQIDNFAVYGALEGLHDNGFRNFSPSDVRRFYGDVGYRYEGSEFHVNMGVADNKFGASATVPVELLQQYWGATYTTPQTTNNRVGYLNFTGKVEATPTWTIDAAAHVRAFEQKAVWTAIRPAPSHAPPTRRCCALATTVPPPTASTAPNSPTRSRRGLCSEKSSDHANPLGVDRGERCRPPTPTSCSGITITSWSAAVSIPASPVSRPPRGIWARSVQTMSSAAAASFSASPAIPSPSVRSRCAPPTATAGSMQWTRSTSPTNSRSRGAGGSTSPRSNSRTRSAPRSTAATRSSVSIRS